MKHQTKTSGFINVLFKREYEKMKNKGMGKPPYYIHLQDRYSPSIHKLETKRENMSTSSSESSGNIQEKTSFFF